MPCLKCCVLLSLNHIDVFSIIPTRYSKFEPVDIIFLRVKTVYTSHKHIRILYTDIHCSHAAFLQALVSYLYKKKRRNVRIFTFKAHLKMKKKIGKAWQLFHLGFKTPRIILCFICIQIKHQHQLHINHLWLNFQMKRGEDHKAQGLFPLNN